MTSEVHRSLPAGERTSLVLKSAGKLGLTPLSDRDLKAGHDSLAEQMKNGIRRDGKTPRLAAYRTRIHPATVQAALPYVGNEPAVIGAFGGTNLKTAVARREPSGLISISAPIKEKSYPRLADRKLTMEQLVDRIVEPLVETIEQLDKTDREQPIRYGLAIALPHENTTDPYGVEAHLDAEKGGILPKGNTIINWDALTEDQRRIILAVNGGIQLALPGVEVRTGVGANDTATVALNASAAKRAQAEGYIVLPNGAVAGSGTNDALELEAGKNKFFEITVPQSEAGIINNEKGQAVWPDTLVSRRMRELLIDNKDLEPDQIDHPRFEQELGQFLGYRLAAGVDLLAENDDLPVANRKALVKEIYKATQEEPALMSLVATGNYAFKEADSTTNHIIKYVAQAMMERAGQLYGIFFATNAEPFQHIAAAAEEEGAQLASLAEGSVIFNAKVDKKKTLKQAAEENMAKLGPAATIYPANGMEGVAELALAYEYMPQAA